ncbi:MAG: retroviral-like aspartic protease family protein [Magnetococcales bacterium]|nr:retroviral-like aspartic protease family protein [Magnetococcales bacterium]
MGHGALGWLMMAVLLIGSGSWAWGEPVLRHCIDARGRTILKGEPCAPGERDRNPLPPDEVIPLLAKGSHGQYWISVLVNNRITVDFLIDTGANVVALPMDVIDRMTVQGLIRPEDWLGMAVSTLADGSSGRHAVARLDSLRIGSRELHQVAVTVTPSKGLPLLGTPVLEQLGAWRIDPKKRQLLILRQPGDDTGSATPERGRGVEKPVAAPLDTRGSDPRQPVSRAGKPVDGPVGKRGPSPNGPSPKGLPAPEVGQGPAERKSLPARSGQPSEPVRNAPGVGKTLRQCWRADGTTYLAVPPCPPGGEVVPLTGRSSE